MYGYLLRFTGNKRLCCQLIMISYRIHVFLSKGCDNCSTYLDNSPVVFLALNNFPINIEITTSTQGD